VLAQAGQTAHAVLIYSQGTTLMTGAWLWSLSSLCGCGARAWVCWRRPAWRPTAFAAGAYAVEAVGYALLAWGFPWLAVGLIGPSATLTVALEPDVTAYVFGTRTYGTLYGPVYAVTRVAAASGALLYGSVFTATGSYTPVLWGMVGGLSVASVLMRGQSPLRTP
jgi:hypothetical protein